MTPIPLRPLHNALVIAASFLVAGALLPWSPRLRLGCCAGVIGIVGWLCISRLREHTAGRTPDAGATEARIERIRAARDARMGRRR